MKVVIVGGVAAGPKTASRINRLQPDAEVTLLDKGKFLSYAGCGLPYYISGVVKEQKELMCTPAGVIRDPVFFQNVKNVKAECGVEVTQIDRDSKRVQVRDVSGGNERWLPYDKLVLATGASPVVPPIPGIDKKNIFTLHSIQDADAIKGLLADGRALDVVIVGGGLIGVEMTEALVERGCNVTLVEMLPQVLSMVDWEMARLVEKHMQSKGVRILTNTRALSFEGAPNAPEVVSKVCTTQGTLPADLVILAIGVRPNVKLARDAGLAIGETTGGICVDDHLRTSDPNIYAAGDCVENIDRQTGRPCYVPLGSTANKHGRIVADNICGGDEVFPGVLASSVCKVFDYAVGRTGLSENAARALGFDVIVTLTPGPDQAHFMPTAKTVFMKLVADRITGRLLGVQAVGPGEGAKRVDIAATAISGGMTIDDVANLDLCYAPPISPAMDNLITAANVARNKRDGHMVGISPLEVHCKMERGDDFLFLDVRSPAEYADLHLPNSELIPLGGLRKRLAEVPKDKEIVTFCKVSLRGYEAARILTAAGYENVKVMDGGIAMWPYETA
jgi:NADPH-dependent 2,4-dienoyl-CoA reductase/sulfur reductase-like enzyme/rhodanese-related sulfurtransferase